MTDARRSIFDDPDAFLAMARALVDNDKGDKALGLVATLRAERPGASASIARVYAVLRALSVSIEA